MTRKQIKDLFDSLKEDKNFPNAVDKRKRGRDFEKLLNELLKLEELDPRTSFRPSGEEVDGSFLYGNRVFLLEAKWYSTAMPASSIYQFKGKVDGKLIGTIGVYISISGFSSEAVDALTFGKSINIILFDKSDLETAIIEDNGFQKVLYQKIRKATEEGQAFFPINSVSITNKNLETEVKTLENIEEENLIFVVEGQTDQHIISLLAERIFKKTGKIKKIRIIVAGGKYSVAKMANSIRDLSDNKDTIVLLADSDFDIEQTNQLLTSALDIEENIYTIIPDPQIETWFINNIRDREDLRKIYNDIKGGKLSIEKLVSEIDIDYLRKNDEAFAKFYEILTKHIA
ncbi:restriction endonuclease [Empedobacter brevis]|uniref:restriction endonuclease n=1 Tax=Empedobacter brevis TaxID=247 RepID=UPI003340D192